MKYPFLFIVVVSILGIIFGSFFSAFYFLFFVLAFSFFSLALFFYDRKRVLSAVLLVGFFFYGAGTVALEIVSRDSIKDNIQEKKEYALRGKIISYPIAKVNYGFKKWEYKEKVKFICQLKEVYKNDRWQTQKGKMDVSVYYKDDFSLREGDDVEFTAYVFSPKRPANPHQFNYKEYLGYQGIVYLASIEGVNNIRKIDSTRFNFNSWRGKLRTFFTEKLSLAIKDREEIDLLKAMVLGERSGISSQLKEIFKRTNTLHILAISGLHLGIIALIIVSVLRFFIVTKRKVFVVTIFFLIVYSWLVGFRPSITRTLIMVLVFLIGRVVYREGNGLNTLSLAAVVILLFDPLALFNMGFQLSFSIVLFLILFTPYIEQNLQKFFLKGYLYKPKDKKYYFWVKCFKFLAGCIAAQLASLPLMSYYFNLFSPVSLLANMVVIVFLYPILLLGFLTLILGLISKTLLLWLTTVNFCFLKGMIITIKALSLIPFSFFYVPAISGVAVIGYYILIGLFLKERYRRLAAIGLFLGGIFLFLAPYWKEKAPQVIFFDVGKGESTLISVNRGKHILIDCGSSSKEEVGRNVILPYLRAEGINCLEAVIVSHFHDDHCNGLFTLIEDIRIKNVFIVKKEEPFYLQEILVKKMKEKGIKVVEVNSQDQGETLSSNLGIEVLSPPKELFYSSSTHLRENDNSMVCRLEIGACSFLFCGDVELKGMKYLSQKGEMLKSLVVKVPHHGGKSSFSKSFYELVKPEIAVICTNKKISKEVRDFFKKSPIRMFKTGDTGAIMITVEKEKCRVETMQKKDEAA